MVAGRFGYATGNRAQFYTYCWIHYCELLKHYCKSHASFHRQWYITNKYYTIDFIRLHGKYFRTTTQFNFESYNQGLSCDINLVHNNSLYNDQLHSLFNCRFNSRYRNYTHSDEIDVILFIVLFFNSKRNQVVGVSSAPNIRV